MSATPMIRVNFKQYPAPTVTMTVAELKAMAGLPSDAQLLAKSDQGLQKVDGEAVQTPDGAEFFTLTSSKRWYQRLSPSSIGSLIAIFISLMSFVYSIWSAADTSARESIRALYDVYFEVSKAQLQVPQLMHIFSLPDSYEDVSRQVRQALIDASDRERAKDLLLERSMADYLFSIFEFMVIDYTGSSSLTNWKRLDFEKKTINYLCLLLKNPRLLYYWDEGRLGSEYRKETQDQYKACVVELGQEHDKVGPLAK